MTNEASKTHKALCEFSCPFQCGSQVTIATLKEHAPLNCSRCIIKCLYKEQGCTWSGHGGSEYLIHLQTCNYTPSSNRINEMINRMNLLENGMNQLTRKLEAERKAEEQRLAEQRLGFS